jgi:hypothetical protein
LIAVGAAISNPLLNAGASCTHHEDTRSTSKVIILPASPVVSVYVIPVAPFISTPFLYHL